MTRQDYRTGAKDMTNEQVLAEIDYYLKYINNDELNQGQTSHLTKLSYFQNLANKRGLKVTA